jgi:hypothetical protein
MVIKGGRPVQRQDNSANQLWQTDFTDQHAQSLRLPAQDSPGSLTLMPQRGRSRIRSLADNSSKTGRSPAALIPLRVSGRCQQPMTRYLALLRSFMRRRGVALQCCDLGDAEDAKQAKSASDARRAPSTAMDTFTGAQMATQIPTAWWTLLRIWRTGSRSSMSTGPSRQRSEGTNVPWISSQSSIASI